MITAVTAGIDLGAKTVKVVVLRGKEVIGRGIATTGLDQKESAEKAFKAALKEAKMDQKDILEK